MSRIHFVQLLAAGMVLLGFVGGATGQIEPLAIGNTTPVLDYLDRPFPGTWLGGSNGAARVEVREVGSGIAAPDPVTGAGNDTANPLFLVTHMGHGVIPNNVESGTFSYTLTNRLPYGVQYFARVYDNELTAQAGYYANSVPFEDVPPAQQSTTPSLTIVFQQQYLVSQGDDSDVDNDGLSAWVEENVTSTDANSWDTDEDGYNDRFEVLHEPYLENGVVNINEIMLHVPDYDADPPPETNEYYVSWWSIPDVGYQLEYRAAMVDGLAFSNIWAGTASGTNLEISVEEWVQTNVGIKGFFRWIVPEE